MKTPATLPAKTPETLRIAENKALNMMTSARCQLMLGGTATTVFFAALALRLTLKIDWLCRTAWTDGKAIGFNPDFILSLTKDEVKGVLVHEVLHCVYKFFSRLGNRDLRDFNSAHDLTINQIIFASGFKLPEGCLMPGKGSYVGFPENGSAEEYYALIAAGKAAKDKAEADAQKDEDGNNTDEPSDDDGADEDTDESGEGDRETSESEPGSGNGQSTEDVDEGSCGGARRPSPSQSEAKELEEDWKQFVSSARDFAHGKGKLPGALEDVCRDILAAEVCWQDRLREFVSEKSNTDYSWTRPNRRFISGGDHFPSLHSEVLGKLVVSVDTSGSIDNIQLNRFASELNGICECMPFEVEILYHHTTVYHQQNWKPTDGKLEMVGTETGGTSHGDVFRVIDEMFTPPVAVICLTDLYTDFPEHAPSMPVLWACTTDMNSVPFGEVLKVNLKPTF